jgi:hypothetical protein
LIAQAWPALAHRLEGREVLVATLERIALAYVLFSFTLRRNASALFFVTQGDRSAALLHGEPLPVGTAALEVLTATLVGSGDTLGTLTAGNSRLAQRGIRTGCNWHRLASGQAGKHFA